MKFTKRDLYVILTGVYVGCLLISNTIGGKAFSIGSNAMTVAVIVFPIVYIANDLLTELYGYKRARNVILLAFAMNVLAVLCYTAAIALPAAPFYQNQAAFATILGAVPRIVIASMAAYLVGSLANSKTMALLKEANEPQLMLRCVLSTLIGETLDATVFLFIAFWGQMPLEALLQMILIYAVFKTGYEIVVYPVTRTVIHWGRALPEE